MAIVGASQGTKAVAARRWLWIGADRELSDEIAGELRRKSVALDLCGAADDLEKRVANVVAVQQRPQLVVCDCSGERGSERGFFVCRAAGDTPVVLLAVGEESELGPLRTMMIGLCKALPESRVALLTDRLPEEARPTGGDARAPWQADDLARLLLRIERYHEAGGRVFRLRKDADRV